MIATTVILIAFGLASGPSAWAEETPYGFRNPYPSKVEEYPGKSGNEAKKAAETSDLTSNRGIQIYMGRGWGTEVLTVAELPGTGGARFEASREQSTGISFGPEQFSEKHYLRAVQDTREQLDTLRQLLKRPKAGCHTGRITYRHPTQGFSGFFCSGESQRSREEVLANQLFERFGRLVAHR